MNRTCRVCHQHFSNYWGFKSHVASEYRRFEKIFRRQANDWQEIVAAFNQKPVEETATKRLNDFIFTASDLNES